MRSTEVKLCNRCGQTKRVDEFYRKHDRPEGWCKACYREWHQERYEPQVAVPDDLVQTCQSCGSKFKLKQRKPAKFCSVYCRNQSRITAEKQMRQERHALLRCEWCGDSLPPTEGRRGRTKFCSVTCQRKARHARSVPAERSAYRFLQKYGLTVERRDAMLAKQGGCAICKTADPGAKGWVVDHDHACCATSRHDEKTCGQCIRGVLCGRCNLAIGLFDDDPSRLRAAANYLKRTRKK